MHALLMSGGGGTKPGCVDLQVRAQRRLLDRTISLGPGKVTGTLLERWSGYGIRQLVMTEMTFGATPFE